MTRKEVHDVVNIVGPALTFTQNLLLGFYGEMAKEQHEAIKKVEICLKELQHYLRLQGRQAEAT